MATLDILIPHFNDVEGLELALASVDAQTWPGTRRIVVADDGSDAEIFDRVRRIAEARAEPVALIRSAANRGRAVTRNMLLDAAESPYLAWLDAGDEWHPRKLWAQFKALAAIEADAAPVWITCNFDVRWVGGPCEPVKQKVDQDQVKALLGGHSLRGYMWTLLGPTQTFRDVGRFDEALPRLQDLDFLVRFAKAGGALRLPGTDESLCAYHKTDIGRSADEIRACYAALFDKHRDVYARYGRRFTRNSLYMMDRHAARCALSNGDRDRYRHYRREAFKRRPLRSIRDAWRARLDKSR